MPSLPKAAMHVLDTFFARSTSRVLETSTSGSGDSTKMLVQLQDGLQVESVLLLYDTTAVQQDTGTITGSRRATLCISSQVGCQMGCTFCATGTMGLRGALSVQTPMCTLHHYRSRRPPGRRNC
jgi:adenine C2-methylase RlmN of 23S rRNA A2503 and tRNA A37